MTLLTAILLGLIQGIGEFLPVSSTGHLALAKNVLNIQGADLTFDAALHVGPLIALIAVYRRELGEAFRGGCGLIGLGPDRGKTTRKNARRRRMGMYTILGSLPLIAALALESISIRVLDSTLLLSLMFLAMGLILWLGDRYGGGYRDMDEAGILRVLAVGAAQAVAVIPGLSRTGLMLTAGQAVGLKRSFAYRLTILLAVPAVLGAAAVRVIRGGIAPGMLPEYLCGMAAAAVSGYFGIRLMKYLMSRGGLGAFAYYCFGAGSVALVLSMIA